MAKDKRILNFKILGSIFLVQFWFTFQVLPMILDVTCSIGMYNKGKREFKGANSSAGASGQTFTVIFE